MSLSHQQNNNIVGGDLAGRDIIHKETFIFENTASKTILSIYEKIRAEIDGDKIVYHKIEDFNHFIQNQDPEVIGLEYKLRDAEFGDLLDFAVNAKDLFAKQLSKYQFYEAAQELYVFLLADVFSKFHTQILPSIREGVSHSEVLKQIQQTIISPIENRLEDNLLRINAIHVWGMIYFLTGNCHIKWK